MGSSIGGLRIPIAASLVTITSIPDAFPIAFPIVDILGLDRSAVVIASFAFE
jgi:hypothetical protein